MGWKIVLFKFPVTADSPQPIFVPVVFVTIILVIFPGITIGSDEKIYVCLTLKSAVPENRSTIQLLRDSRDSAYSISDDRTIPRERHKHTDATLAYLRPNIPATDTPGQQPAIVSFGEKRRIIAVIVRPFARRDGPFDGGKTLGCRFQAVIRLMGVIGD
jgi:hypothetical protein